MASISVLNEVMIIQRIGKKMTKADPQPSAVRRIFSRAVLFMAWSPSVGDVLGDGADEEDRDDVREDHRDHASGRRRAHVEVEECPLVDEEGEVRGGEARSAAGR